VGASTAGGRLGGIGTSLNNALSSIFGKEPVPCPFLQKGALSGLLGIETGSKVVTVVNSSSKPSATSCGDPDAATDDDISEAQLQVVWDQDDEAVVFNMGGINGPYDELVGVRVDSILNPATQELTTGSSIAAELPNGNWICCTKTGPCECAQEDDGTETSKISTREKYKCNLRYYMMTEALGYSSQAAKDAEFGAFAARPMPSYICVIIFGLIPFLVLYYLIQDLLAFVFVANVTKKMIAVAMAAMAIVTGAFADVAYMLTKLTSISLSWSFLFLIFGTGLAAVVITNMMGLTSAASAMHRSLNEAHYGFMMLRSFGQQLESASGKKE
jgi:hypothetical protein